MKKIVYLLIALIWFSSIISAEDFGASGALVKNELELEEMLSYAIQDEYLALREYEALIDEFGLDRPYSNIAESEKTHIRYLETIYRDYNIDIPEVLCSNA